MKVIALSSDTRERAQAMADKLKAPGLRVGYDLPLAVARGWGLYISTSRGTTSIGIEEPALFAEPAVYLVRPDGTLYYGAVQTMPFARPHFDETAGRHRLCRGQGLPGARRILRRCLSMVYRAIAFDTGGTVLNWHGLIVDELAAFAPWQGLAFDRHEFVNEWRRRTMKGIVGQVRPAFDMDDVHLSALARKHCPLPSCRRPMRRSARSCGAPGTACAPGRTSHPRWHGCASGCRWCRSRCCPPRW